MKEEVDRLETALDFINSIKLFANDALKPAYRSQVLASLEMAAVKIEQVRVSLRTK